LYSNFNINELSGKKTKRYKRFSIFGRQKEKEGKKEKLSTFIIVTRYSEGLRKKR